MTGRNNYMRKLICMLIVCIFVTLICLPAVAGPDGKSKGSPGAVDTDKAATRKNALFLYAQGFAFKGKDFETVKLGIEYESDSKNDSKGDKAAKVPHPDGQIAIGDFNYAIKIVMLERGKISADLFSMSDFDVKKDEKPDKLKLPMPIGHMSLKKSDRNQPILLGTLRINDEETAMQGEFDLYLNDLTP